MQSDLSHINSGRMPEKFFRLGLFSVLLCPGREKQGFLFIWEPNRVFFGKPFKPLAPHNRQRESADVQFAIYNPSPQTHPNAGNSRASANMQLFSLTVFANEQTQLGPTLNTRKVGAWQAALKTFTHRYFLFIGVSTFVGARLVPSDISTMRTTCQSSCESWHAFEFEPYTWNCLTNKYRMSPAL